MVCLVATLTISSASASDLNESDISTFDNEITENIESISISDDTVELEANNNAEVLSNTYYPNNFSEIKSSISSASDGDTIILNGYYSFSDLISVGKSVEIIGINNPIVDGLNSVKLFDVSSSVTGGVTFKGITFVNAKSMYAGACYGGSFINCTFINNTATYGGGALTCPKMVINCTFINNSGPRGDAIYFDNDYSENIGSVENCTFINNSGSSEGTIYYSRCYGNHIINCRFTGNSANGAVISFNAISNDFYIVNCSFISNSIVKGKIIKFSYGNGNGSAVNCTFSDNINCPLSDCSVLGCNFSDNINCHLYDCSVVNCSFIGNSDESGGALYYTKTAINCIFINNSASSNGGAISGPGSCPINCTFINNTATYGGAIEGGGCSAVNCTFINNYATVDGGAMAGTCNNNNFLLNCIFIDNHADGKGGAAQTGYGLNVTNCTFINNSADKGGVFYWTCDSTQYLNITSCNFTGNSANQGGILYFENGKYLNIENSIFENSGDDSYLKLRSTGIIYNVTDCIFDIAPNNINFYYNSHLKVNDLVLFIGQDGFLVANLSDVRGPLSNKNVIFTINGQNHTFKTDSNGIYQFNIRNYLTNEGNYTITSTYLGDDMNFPVSTKSNVIISQILDSFLVVDDISFYMGSDGFLVANLSDLRGPLANKDIIFKINGTNHVKSTDSNGLASINVADYLGMAGEYVVGVSFSGDEYDKSASKNITVNINRYDSELTHNDLTIYVGSDGFLVANLSDLRGPLTNKKIIFKINNIDHVNYTDASGSATINVADYLNQAGEYVVGVSFSGDEYDKSVSKNATVKINKYNPDLNFNDNRIFYSGINGYLVATLTDLRGAIAYKPVTFNVNNASYNITTDSQGQAKFNVKDYLKNAGNYTITVAFAGDDSTKPISRNVVIQINNYKGFLTIQQEGYFYNHSRLIFKLVDLNTNQPVSDVLINLQFSNRQNVNVTTNDEGIARYNVDFVPGSYNVYAKVIGESSEVNDEQLDFYISTLYGKISLTQVNGNTLNIKLFNSNTGELFTNVKVTLRFDDLDPIELVTNNKGIATYVMPFAPGIYSVLVAANGQYMDFEAVMQNIEISDGNSNNKIDSKITLSPITFTYGGSGSTVVSIIGGTIKSSGISVDNHPEIKPRFEGNKIIVSGLGVGTYTLRVTTTPFENYYSVTETTTITVNKISAVVKASKITVALKKGTLWKITIINSKTGKPISGLKLTLKVYTGKNYKTASVTTNSKGVASYQTKSLSKGTHKVVVSTNHAGYKLNPFYSSIKVIKQTAVKFKLQKRTNDKNGALVSYIVMNKKTKKGINGVKIKLLIYTGKNVKTVTLKSKKSGKYNGAMGFATNELSVGKHKVVIMPASIKYGGSAKTSMIIKKAAKKRQLYSHKL